MEFEDDIPPEFNQEKLFEYVKKYSFPRRIGTRGEKIVRKMIYHDFRKIGLKPQREHFICSLFYSVNFLRITLLLLLMMILLMEFVFYLNPIFNLVMFGIFIFLALFMLRMSQKPHKINWGRNYMSSNLFAFVPAKSYGENGNLKVQGLIEEELDEDQTPEDMMQLHDDYEDFLEEEEEVEYGKLPSSTEMNYGNIIISAHSDSKSQSIPTYTRVILFKNVLILFGILCLLFIIGVILAFLRVPWVWFPLEIVTSSITVTLSVLTLILFINKSKNESPGACDNASGMAVVFALADYFKKRPLERFNLYFCQFGVEEFGQQGARRFILNRLRFFKRRRTFNFNLDMVGERSEVKLPIITTVGLTKKPVDPVMMHFIRESADELDIEIEEINLATGAHTDRMAFTKYGYNGIDFASRLCAKWTHTPEDTPDKVSPLVMHYACRVICRSIKKMDVALKNSEFEEPEDAKHLRQAYY